MINDQPNATYSLFVEMLSDMVTSFLHALPTWKCKPVVPLSDWKSLLRHIQAEEEQLLMDELTAELLGTDEFVAIA